jgi:cytochrome c2
VKTIKRKAAPTKKHCTSCHRIKADVKRQINPYDLDVNGVKNYQNLCTKCVNTLIDDI